MRIAAIDIGTVTCRLLVADVENGRLAELARECDIANLGEGVDATGELSAAAMERVRVIIERYLAVIREYERPGAPVRVIALATSASRDARNASDFVAMLAEQGVQLTVIPGEREAALSFRGASLIAPGRRVLVADVGGGSTELIAGVGGADPIAAQSFQIGCRRVTERLFRSDPPDPEQVAAARAWAHDEFAPFFAHLADAGFVADELIAVAGTATTVVSIQERMAVYDSARVHGYHVSKQVLDQVERRLNTMPLEERLGICGLQPGRAPVIGAGMAILQEVVALAGTGGYTVSESDILQGIILDAAC